MKQIDDYVESLFENYRKSKDLLELKEETRTHLLESVGEFRAEGKSDEESVSLSIERFGDNNNVQEDLVSVLGVRRRVFVRPLLHIALTCLVFGVVLSGIIQAFNMYFLRTQNTFNVQMYSVFKNNNFQLSPVRENEIRDIAQRDHIAIKNVAVYHTSDPLSYPTGESPTASLTYDSNVQPNAHSLLGFAYTTKNENALHWDIMAQYRISPYINPETQIIPIVLIAFYWILFAIWSSINAHHRKRLSWIWIAAFSCLNIFAWLLFLLVKPTSSRLQHT